jgi:hypothetical protein
MLLFSKCCNRPRTPVVIVDVNLLKMFENDCNPEAIAVVIEEQTLSK